MTPEARERAEAHWQELVDSGVIAGFEVVDELNVIVTPVPALRRIELSHAGSKQLSGVIYDEVERWLERR